LFVIKKHQDHPFKFIITETVFGMDGDCVHLNALKELCKRYKAFLYLDEAHATGLYGPKGYGLSTTLDLCEIPHVIMGSFSKALGGSGGYIACSNTVKDYLVNKAGGFIYSTAPSQAVLAGVLKAWEMIPKLEEKRTHLKELGHYFSSGLKQLGFDGSSYYHIVPVIIGCDKKTIHLKNELLKYNIIVSGIRSPTVAIHTARLRFCLNASHSFEKLAYVLKTLKKVI
jgi:8-amino-7-oxononanoate synthase